MDNKNKRGRKPKSASTGTGTGECLGAQSPNGHAHMNTSGMTTTLNTPALKSRRGRKPKAVFNGFDNVNDVFHSNSDDENIIMKLKVFNEVDESVHSQLDDESNLFPDAYNEVPTNTYESKPCEIDYVNHSSKHDSSSTHYAGLKVIDLLKDFEEKNKNNEWPQTTSIACYWCCHKFDTPPFGIPVKFADEKFHVFGCFCSLECAAAYNLASKESIDEVWERHNLINLLSKRIGYKNIVKPAPNRLALQMFGGHLTIEEYRSYCHTSKIININFPPMMTMTQQIEEVNESDINNDYKYIPIDTDRINKYKEKIKLKRTKPITSFENTLDHAMNLKFNSS